MPNLSDEELGAAADVLQGNLGVNLKTGEETTFGQSVKAPLPGQEAGIWGPIGDDDVRGGRPPSMNM